MYLSLLGLEHGVDPKSAFTSVSNKILIILILTDNTTQISQVIILSLTGIIGRVGFGFASDICGPWNLLIPVSGFLSLMLLTTCAVYVIWIFTRITSNLMSFPTAKAPSHLSPCPSSMASFQALVCSTLRSFIVWL